MTLSSNGRILELEKLFTIKLEQAEKEHFGGLYDQLKKIFCQKETANIIDELEHYIAQNQHFLGTNESK